MTENINKCIAAGCKSECCKNLIMIAEQQKRERAYPEAKKVSEDTNMDDLLETYPPGVYVRPTGFRSDSGWSAIEEIAIVGPCPNLGIDGNCEIYLKNYRPEACDNLKQCSTSCIEFRSRDESFIIPLESVR